jgi:hypothetical protein
MRIKKKNPEFLVRGSFANNNTKNLSPMSPLNSSRPHSAFEGSSADFSGIEY